MYIRPLARVATLATALSLALAGAASAAPYDSDTLLVKFKPSATAVQRSAVLSTGGVGNDLGTIGGIGTHVVSVSADPATLARALSRNPVVEYAEPNFVLRANATPNDPLYTEEYGLPVFHLSLNFPHALRFPRPASSHRSGPSARSPHRARAGHGPPGSRPESLHRRSRQGGERCSRRRRRSPPARHRF